MIELRFHDANATVRVTEDGLRHLMVADPASGITVHVPFPEEAAQGIAEMLVGSPIVVAPASILKANGSLVEREG
jgi:hypothetical protein